MIADKTHFDRICLDSALQAHKRSNIGTYKEFSLHSVLKKYYCENEACHEIPTDGYVADIKDGNRIIEIQTSGFYTMKRKLEVFLRNNDVTVVYPIVKNKLISWVDPESGEIVKTTKSPKHPPKISLLKEIYGIRDLIPNERLSFDVVEVKATDYRLLNGFGKDKKSKATKVDRIPTELIDITHLSCAEDYRKLMPFEKDTDFTAADLAKSTRLNRADSYKAIAVFKIFGIIRESALNGRCKIYKVT